MIDYNPKVWFGYIFRFHKAETFQKLWPLMLAIAIYSAVFAVIEEEFLQLKMKEFNHLKNVPTMHSLLGFVISLLLVFRTNTAYDRWWEGRKLWGSLVNNSRNLAMKVRSALEGDSHQRSLAFFREAIPMYAFALKNHLMRKETNGIRDLDKYTLLAKLDPKKHVPNQLAQLMFNEAERLRKDLVITNEQYLFLNDQLSSFTDICGACERIRNTPIPFSYTVFIKKFIFIYVMTLPLGYVFSMGYWVIPVVVLIFYVVASLEVIAEEIEEPFGGDANDLPMESICKTISNSINEILD